MHTNAEFLVGQPKTALGGKVMRWKIAEPSDSVVVGEDEDNAGRVVDSPAAHAEGSVVDSGSWDSVHRIVQASVASMHKDAAGETPAVEKCIHPEGIAGVVDTVTVGAIAQVVVTELILGLIAQDIVELDVDS